MSLGPVIIREPGDEVTASTRIVYRSFIEELDRGTSPERAILRTARRTGLPRKRVLAIIRDINKEAMP